MNNFLICFNRSYDQVHVYDAGPDTHPVAAAMTQPPCSALASMQQPSWSWLMPTLWPISWAMVAAAPIGTSEWSCGRLSEVTILKVLL